MGLTALNFIDNIFVIAQDLAVIGLFLSTQTSS